MLNDEDIKVITGHLDRIATALELKAENINMHQEKRWKSGRTILKCWRVLLEACLEFLPKPQAGWSRSMKNDLLYM